MSEIKDTINIVMICDDNYALPTAIAITSIKENKSSDRQYKIHVIGLDISVYKKNKILLLNDNNFSVNIIERYLSNEQKMVIKSRERVTHAALYKFDIPIIFEEHDKVLYVDSDVVVLSDLIELYNIELGEKYAAVVKDVITINNTKHLERINFIHCDYFNSGVMLLNLKKMREELITDKLIDYRLNGENHFMDQDALNVVFDGNVLFISPYYNLLNCFFEWNSLEDLSEFYETNFPTDKEDVYDNAKILHFGDKKKPWKTNLGYLSKIYDHYYLLSPFTEKTDIETKVSIIMPSLNMAQYIKQCIESVVNQTLNEIEIICVDAGSTDGTLEILQHFASRDSRIKIIISDKKSYGYQMNLGIAHAKGNYIGIVETDDYILPNMYETLYNVAVNERVQVVKSDYCRFTTPNGVIEKDFKVLSTHDNLYCTRLNPSITPSLVMTNTLNQIGIYNLSFIKSNNIKFNESPGASFQDNGFHFQVFCWADSMFFVKSAFYMLCRDNPNSSVLSFGNYNKLYCMCDEYDFILEFLNKNPKLKERFKKVFVQKCLGNYEFVLNRIPYEFRKEFLYNLSLKFTQYQNMNLYNLNDLNEPQRNKLIRIIEDPVAYSKNMKLSPISIQKSSVNNNDNDKDYDKLNGQLSWARRELTKVRAERLEYKKELARVRGIKYSLTYKLGSMITWLPRKVKNAFKSEEIQVYSTTKNKNYEYYKSLPTKYYRAELIEWYKKQTGETLNLDNPKTFNEKIQWLKLYDSTPIKTKLADKYLVRDWIKEQIGDEYLVPLLGVWDSFDEIDFDKLPNQFVLKANHGCGWNYIVKDKSNFNKDDAKSKFDIWMKKDFSFVAGFELHYSNIPPKIIAEQFIQNADDLYDYKFMCFDGRVDFLWVCSNRATSQKNTMYDLDYNKLNVKFKKCDTSNDIVKPINFNKMIELSKILGKGFACVRVDFYEIDGKVYFGEMTFTSGSGLDIFEPHEFMYELGSKLKLPKKKQEIPILDR